MDRLLIEYFLEFQIVVSIDFGNFDGVLNESHAFWWSPLFISQVTLINMSLVTMRSVFASSSRLAFVPSLNAQRSYLTSTCAGRVPVSLPHLTPSSLSTRGYAANAPEPKSPQSTTAPEPAKLPTAAELAEHKKKQLLAAEAMKVRMRKAKATGQDVRDPKAISTITSQPWPLFSE